MALIFRGKTICSICKRVIGDTDAIVAFTAFLGASHKFAAFSDGVFHEACFHKHPDASEVLATYERWKSIWDGRPLHLTDMAEIEAWGREAFKSFQ